MFQGQARWFLLAGLSSSAFLGCSGEEPAGGGNAGNSPGGTSAGSGVQGGAGGAGGTSGGAAGSMSAGTGGGGAASGGMGGGAGGSGGSGGNAGGSAGSGGSGGTGMPTAVANITAILGGGVTGTATFTQGAMMTKLVINLTACPDGAHATHLHETNDCANNGEAAGGHWVPNGEMLGETMCANNTGMHMKEKPIAEWTVGGAAATDVTKHAFMVHTGGDGNPGGKIGCGVIAIKP